MPTTINGTTGVSQIQDDTVTIPKIDATGTPSNTTFLRGDGAWATAGSPPGTIELLQEDIITTSGTWTRASGFNADDTVMIFLVGGGASGCAARLSSTNTNGAATGGTAGSCFIITARYADVPSSAWTLTAGAGGAAVSASTDGTRTVGNSGNTTTLVNGTTAQRFESNGGFGGRGLTGSGRVDLRRYYNEVNGLTTQYTGVYIANASGSFVSQAIGGPLTDLYQSASVLENNCAATVVSAQTFTGADSQQNKDVITDVRYLDPTMQIIGSGGSAARQGATDRTSWNPKVPALFNTGGNGSGTANGQNATGIGGGGGGCVRPAGTIATSGTGGAGGMVVRYYRGRVSPWQVINAIGA